jgi:superfamily II DNA helicase RecQ
VLVEYRPSAISQTEPVRKTEKSRDESYKEKLTETDWPLFNVLREWRAERCKEEGIPPYVICTNLQLAKGTQTNILPSFTARVRLSSQRKLGVGYSGVNILNSTSSAFSVNSAVNQALSSYYGHAFW